MIGDTNATLHHNEPREDQKVPRTLRSSTSSYRAAVRMAGCCPGTNCESKST
jgi:hypothetical protein